MMQATAQQNKCTRRTRPVTRVGKVVSDKRDKTITVVYQFTVKHEKYGKYFKRSTTLHTHDEKNEAKVGDVVEVYACRPLSKTKTWRLGRIITRSGDVQ